MPNICPARCSNSQIAACPTLPRSPLAPRTPRPSSGSHALPNGPNAQTPPCTLPTNACASTAPTPQLPWPMAGPYHRDSMDRVQDIFSGTPRSLTAHQERHAPPTISPVHVNIQHPLRCPFETLRLVSLASPTFCSLGFGSSAVLKRPRLNSSPTFLHCSPREAVRT